MIPKRFLALMLLLICVMFVWSANGDTFEYTTDDGYTLRFLVLNEAEKTVQIGGNHRLGEYKAVVKRPSNSYMATLKIPENVWHGNKYTVTAIGKEAFYEDQWLKRVVIPETVTDIGEYAFYWCNNLSEANLPKDIKTIQEFTFYYTSLDSVNIPERVDSIKRSAFNGTFIKNLYIPSSVKYIHSVSGQHAFMSVIGLLSIKVDEGNTVFESKNACNAIIEKSSMRLIKGCRNTEIPYGVRVVGGNAMDYAFYSQERDNSYNDLTTPVPGAYSINLPETVIELENNCFKYCNEIGKIILPKNLNKIGEWTFYGCSGLDTIVSYIKEPFEISSHNFQYWSNRKQQVLTIAPVLYVPKGTAEKYRQTAGWNIAREIIEMPSPAITFADANVKTLCVSNWDTNGDGELDEDEAAAVTSLGVVFSGNTSIQSFDELRFFTGLTSIEDNSFYDCFDLKTITIPQNVVSIGNRAFCWCSALNAITLPDNVESIGEAAFASCNSLNTITIGCGLSTVGFQAFESCDKLSAVNINSIEAWCNIEFDELSNPLQYAHHLFLDGEEIKELVIPNSVSSIGKNAFRECNLTSVTIGENVQSIGDWAFTHCHSITSLTLPDNLSTIGEYAFFYCYSLISLTIPQNVRVIGESAFGNCKGLTSLVLGETLTFIGGGAFEGCSGLNSITIPSKVTSIEHGTFRDCSGLETISIPNSVSSIYSYAFQGCSSLSMIKIPNSVRYIGDDGVFWGCSTLKSIIIPSSVESIGNRTFYGCSSLTSVTIPHNLTSIGYCTFENCNSLTSVIVEIGAPVSIDEYTFSNRANATLYVPLGSKTAYETIDYWKDFKKIVEFPNPDVNQDDNVNVVDVVDIARFVVGSPAQTFVEFIADINSDGAVDLGDAVCLVNEIAGDQNFVKAWNAPSGIDANDALSLTGSNGTLSLNLENERCYTAFQFDLYVPENSSISQMMLNAGRKQGHQLLNNKVEEGHYRVAALSTSNHAFNGNDGELLSITMNGTSGDEVSVRNIRFFDAEGHSYQLGDVDGAVATSLNRPSSDPSLYGGEIYDLQGRKRDSLHRGVNIVGGKKMIVK